MIGMLVGAVGHELFATSLHPTLWVNVSVCAYERGRRTLRTRRHQGCAGHQEFTALFKMLRKIQLKNRASDIAGGGTPDPTECARDACSFLYIHYCYVLCFQLTDCAFNTLRF